MRRVAVGLNAAIIAVTDDQPRVLTVGDPSATAPGARSGESALPFGRLDPEGDRTLELGLRRWVREQTGVELGYVEQLYTFGDRERHLGGDDDQTRVLSVAYVALLREREAPTTEAHWRNVYDLLPWEDWRRGRPALIGRRLSPRLREWAAAVPALRRARRERVEIAFGLGGARWDEERVLDRYELLYEAALIPEASRDALAARSAPAPSESTPAARGAGREARLAADPTGRSMVLDHRRIVATALGRLRGKIKYRPVVFELLPPTFTLLQLQRLVEALAGIRLHKQNFRRLVEKAGLVEGTGRVDTKTGGRPAELFTFRREVLRERPAPGVGLPGLRS